MAVTTHRLYTHSRPNKDTGRSPHTNPILNLHTNNATVTQRTNTAREITTVPTGKPANNGKDNQDKPTTIAPLVAQIDNDYRKAFDTYLEHWGHDVEGTPHMSASEVVRVAVAKFIGYAYTPSKRTRVKKYATEEARLAAAKDTQSRNAETFAIKRTFSTIVAALAGKGMVTELVTLTNDYNAALGKDGVNLQSKAKRDDIKAMLLHTAHNYDVKIIERTVKNKDDDSEAK